MYSSNFCKMKKTKYAFLLFIISAAMLICGCRSHKRATKYGPPPVTKYGVKTTEFNYIAPQNSNQKV